MGNQTEKSSESENSIERINYVALLTAAACSLLCFLPYYLHDGMDKSQYSVIDEIPLRNVIFTLRYQFSLVASLAVTFPVLIDYALDTYWSVHISLNNLIAMWTLILSVTIPCIILFFYGVPALDFELTPLIISLRNILMFYSASCFLHTYGPDIWTRIKTNIIVVTFSTSQVLYSCHVFNYTKTVNALSIIYYIFLIISFIIFIILGMIWMKHMIITYNMVKEFTDDEIRCTMHFSAVLLYIIAICLVYMLYGTENWTEQNALYISSVIYLQTTYSVIITVINGRLVRREMLIRNAKNQLVMKRMLVGYFSHELRTPLNSLSMGLQILKRSISKIKGARDLNETTNELQASCDSAVDILNDLLTYESLESGSAEVHKAAHQVQSFLDGILDPFRLQAEAKRITFRIEFSRTICQNWHNCSIDIDEGKFGRVLRNLLTNAMQNTPSGGFVGVSVRLKNFGPMIDDTGTNSKLHLDVVDTGPGISKEDQTKLFKDAISFTAGVLQAREGMGLGLWISRQYMLLHQGDISVTSEGDGLGSTFTVMLPARYTPAEDDFTETVNGKKIGGFLRGLKRLQSAKILTEDSRSSPHKSSQSSSYIRSIMPSLPATLIDTISFHLSLSSTFIPRHVHRLPHLSAFERVKDRTNGLFRYKADTPVTPTRAVEVPVQPATTPDNEDSNEGRKISSIQVSPFMAPARHFQPDTILESPDGADCERVIPFGHSNELSKERIPPDNVIEEKSKERVEEEKGDELVPSESNKRKSSVASLFSFGNTGLGRGNSEHFSTRRSSRYSRNEVSSIRSKADQSSLSFNSEAENIPSPAVGKFEKASLSNRSFRLQNPFRRQAVNGISIYMMTEPKKKRVLVVDDAPINVKMLSRLIKECCDETKTAEDGSRAVEEMQISMDTNTTFDLVLMDYQMPVMDGPSAAKAMRAMGFKGPIIGVTGNALPQHFHTYIAHGANAVIQKPFKLEELRRVLKELDMEDVLCRDQNVC